VTRVPRDEPERLEPPSVSDRVAGAIRRHVLAAAQSSLRALREILAQLPRADASTRTSTPAAPPTTRRTDGHAGAAPTRPQTPHEGPYVPPADLLRSSTLPSSYGSDRIVLLARDPHCLYAYWDLSSTHVTKVRASAASDQLRLVLRAYDVTQIAFDAKPPTRFQDFSVAAGASSLYAYIGKPASCFVVEVGFLRPDGTFFVLARSQPVWTPRTDQPGPAPGRWMTVGWTERRDAGEVLPRAATPGATVEPTRVAPRSAPSSWPGEAPSAAQRGSWSLVRGGRSTPTLPDPPSAVANEPE
jgi:hypothetical protein